jgi:hypothetical protein
VSRPQRNNNVAVEQAASLAPNSRKSMEAPHIWDLQLQAITFLYSHHHMFARFTPCSKLPSRVPLQQWPTTKVPVVATMVRRIATGSASGRIAAVVGVEAEAVDPFSTAAVRIRKEIWGVRNISKLRATLELHSSN